MAEETTCRKLSEVRTVCGLMHVRVIHVRMQTDTQTDTPITIHRNKWTKDA